MRKNEYPEVVSFRLTKVEKQKFDELVNSAETSRSKFLRDRFVKLLTQKKAKA